MHGVGFQAAFFGDVVFRLHQWLLNGYALPYSKGSLKTNPMERRQLADILHLGKPAMLCLKLLATRRRRSIPFSGCLPS
ncbi:hypothetical protein [Kingella oralis]|uniref:hypothetical protein n=1 Tax=Kingella oralis TaxID=505 RepID=UPI002D80806E|nr:hypothetical protein [Kingella oralis]